MSSHSFMPAGALLATWTNAWLSGQVPFDAVLEALARSDANHVVIGLPVAVSARRETTGPELPADVPQPVSAALIAWRPVTTSVRVVLPAAGDVRGLTPATDFARAALATGQGVLGGGLGLVPDVTAASASSARPAVTWQAFAVDDPRPDPLSLGEATQELAVAMRETASLFTARDLTGTRSDVAEALTRARRAGERLDLPPQYPARAVGLAAQAERLAAVLAIATTDVQGGSVDRLGMADRADALRTLAGVVRRARQAAYNATAG